MSISSSSSTIYTKHVLTCGSTMEEARSLACVRPELFGIVTATEQTGGRGRRGSNWLSPPGGFWGTFWIKTELTPAQLNGFSLAVGVLMHRVLSSLQSPIWLKWPNDLVTKDGLKVGGILIEIGSPEGSLTPTHLDTAGQFILAGVGINLQAPELLKETAAGLADVSIGSITATAAIITESLVEALPNFWDEFVSGGVGKFLPEWRTYCVNISKLVEFTRGNTRERGVFADVGPAGEALIETEGRTERFFSGEIHTVREAKTDTAKD